MYIKRQTHKIHINMSCDFCCVNVSFPCHIIRSYGGGFDGYGTYCCPNCALRDLKRKNYGESDYFNAYALTNMKYSQTGEPFSLVENDYAFVRYLPNRTRNFAILESAPLQEKIAQYKVRKRKDSGKKVNDIIKDEFFSGKCRRVESGATLCPTKQGYIIFKG